jgi:predicted house-cleaning noncanonical NTP pyrophosphatase (MazG superfamily)
MKLVRENVAKRIMNEDSKQISKIFDQDEFMTFLKLKLAEEIIELKNSDYKDLSEYADVLEVLDTIMFLNGTTFEAVLDVKERKTLTEGSLKEGYLWIQK